MFKPLVSRPAYPRYATALAMLLMPFSAVAEPLKLPAGMQIELEAQHHVNSSYVPAGSPIYFRVARDVQIEGQTLVPKGALAVGRMEQAQERGRVGKAGSMSLAVDSVVGVDGTSVAVDADVAKQGRSRAGATVAWTLFWGVPGLITQGVNPYLERGATITAMVRSDAMIDPGNARPPFALPEPAALMATVKGAKVGTSKLEVLKFNIEKDKSLKPITLEIDMPASAGDPSAALGTLRLVAVDGVAVPTEVIATGSSLKTATFDGWSLVRFLREGSTDLRFLGRTAEGQPFEASWKMQANIIKKG